MKVHVSFKVEKDGVIVGVIANPVDSEGSLFIQKSKLGSYTYDNIRLTSDYKILGDIPIKNYDDVFTSKVTLYHGTAASLKGRISPNLTRGTSDFGSGFYMGEFEKQASTWVADKPSPLIYKLSVDLTGLKVFDFEDKDTLWAMYIAVNRKFKGTEGLPKLQKLVNQINSYDVLVGLIADDKMFSVYNRFLTGACTTKALVEALRYVKLGNQYVFKTEKACNKIKILSKRSVSPREKREADLELKNKTQGIEGVVRSMEARYRRSGKYIDELLEEFK